MSEAIVKVGVGATLPPAGIDPMSDAISAVGTLGNMLVGWAAGTPPTPDQLAIAQQNLQSIAQDLQQIQAQCAAGKTTTTTSTETTYSQAAVAGVAAGAALVGGVIGYYIRGRK